MCNISHVFLDYMNTFLETIHHNGGEHDEDIGSWFYCDCHLMGCLKNYLNIWILKNKKKVWP